MEVDRGLEEVFLDLRVMLRGVSTLRDLALRF
jgi:hypothetical protein